MRSEHHDRAEHAGHSSEHSPADPCNNSKSVYEECQFPTEWTCPVAAVPNPKDPYSRDVVHDWATSPECENDAPVKVMDDFLAKYSAPTMEQLHTMWNGLLGNT